MGLGRFRALGAALLTAGLILSTPLAASAEEPTDPGKSSIVAPCKKGGWMALAPEDDAGVPFRNQGECIQYVAQGGSAVATTGTPVAPGQGKGCKAAKQKADKSAASGQQAEPKGKPCKPRKAKAHGTNAE